MIAAVIARTSVASLRCALLLSGCQLYWRKPGANLVAFSSLRVSQRQWPLR
jgi:hypothetical protein